MTGGRSLVVLALALVGFSPRLSAQTTTLYSANFDSGTAEGWAFSSNNGVGYQLTRLLGNDWLLGPVPTRSGNLYSAPIDLTGYTSGNKLVLSFDLENFNNTYQTLLVGIGDAPAPAAWLISSTANNWGPLHADLSASGVKQHFAFDITSYVTSFLATGGSVTGFRLAVMNYSDFQWLYIDNIALTATPATVAGAPTGVSASGGDTQAVVSFTAPASDGNSAITSYTVTSSPGGVTASGTASPLTVTGLTNGTSYTFTVTATNGLGTSSASGASSAVTPATVPTVTTPTSASVTATTATLGGNVTADGGSGVTVRGVVVAPTAATSNPQLGLAVVSNVEGAGTTGVFTVAVTGLTAGTAYTFAAYATNNVGTVYSATATFTSTTVPGAPTAVSATRGNAQATVSFTAPVSNGGSAITGFTVTASPGGATASGASSPLTVTGLTNGTSYTFTVTAANAVGIGAASSASSAVTPAAPPTVTTPTSASVTATAATLGGNVTAEGASGVTARGVVVALTATNSNPQLGGTGVTNAAGTGTTGVFTVAVTGLTGGTAYTYAAYATNSAGTTYSSTATFTTSVVAPDAPTAVAAAWGNRQAVVSFTAPASTGGAAITGYTVTATPAGGGPAVTASGSHSPITVTGLTNGTSYTFTVTATNAVGPGPASSASAASTPAPSVTLYAATFEDGTVANWSDNGAAVAVAANPSTGGINPSRYALNPSRGSGVNCYSPAIDLSAYTSGYALTLSFDLLSEATAHSLILGFGSGPSPAGWLVTSTAVDGIWGGPGTFNDDLAATGTWQHFSFNLTPALADWLRTGANAATFRLHLEQWLDAGGGVSYVDNLTLTASPPAVVPDPPTGVSAAAGDTQAAVSFTAPVNPGGALLTGYTATASPGGATASGATSPLTVTGLTNGTSYTFTVTATNSVGIGAASSASSAITPVAVPTISTPPTSSVIVYGQTLAAATLSGGAGGVAGSFAFTTPATAPGAGTAAQGVTFTPTDLVNYTTATTTVNVTVAKATPTLTWSTPSALTYGTTLSGPQLNATASVAGTFVYSPAAGSTPAAGTQTLGVTFTPTDPANYTSATGSVSLVVSQATPTMTTAPTATALTYGQTLADSALSGGAGSVAGRFAFTAPTTAPGAGTAAQSVTFTPTDAANYHSVTTTVNVTVVKATPTITWATPNAITYGTALSGTQLNATASASGNFSYSPASGATLGAGPQSLSASFTPTDSSNYTPATGAVTLAVGQATPTITTAPTASVLVYGQTLADSTLSGGAASVAGRFVFTTPTTAPGAGTAAQNVTFTPTDTANYTTATTPVNVTVNRATPTLTWAAPAAILQGTALSGVQLSAMASVAGTFTYSPAAGSTPAAGVQALHATFTPTDTVNYAPATAIVSLAVGKLPTPPVITSVVVGHQQAMVIFNIPADDGGLAITGYTVTATPTGLTPTGGTLRALATRGKGPAAATAGIVVVTGTTSPIIVTGLVDGVIYSFSVSAANSLGASVPSAPSDPVMVAAAPPTRLSNMSVRIGAGTGDRTLIVGFVVGGTGTSGAKPLLIRGVGPTLSSYGVAGTLVDPSLALIPQGSSTALAANDNWGGDAQLTAVGNTVGAFPLGSAASKDAALYLTPAKGAYTVQVTGVGGAEGIALAEIYDASGSDCTASTPRLINVSARAQVGTGDGVLIAGFVIEGTASCTVLIRAVGPTLATYGVGGVLADPQLELTQAVNGANVVVATNDNWGGDAQITSVANTVGAFALSGAASKDAAILVTLPPGIYSAKASGAVGSTGVALIEVYEVP